MIYDNLLLSHTKYIMCRVFCQYNTVLLARDQVQDEMSETVKHYNLNENQKVSDWSNQEFAEIVFLLQAKILLPADSVQSHRR